MSNDSSYDVQFVDDEDLPPGHPWVFICTGVRLVLVMKRSHVTPIALTDAWAVYREIVERKAVPMVA